jgi:hypothetical protein
MKLLVSVQLSLEAEEAQALIYKITVCIHSADHMYVITLVA